MKLILFLFILVICISCKDKKQEMLSSGRPKLPVIDISSVVNDVKTTPLKASELISGFDYIEPEMTSKSIITSLMQLGYSQPLFTLKYIYATGESTYDLKFDRQTGKYLGQMGKMGRGAGEYVRGLDRCIDASNDQYIVLSIHQSLYIYDDSNHFVRKLSIPIKTNYWSGTNFTSIRYVSPGKVMLLGDGVSARNPQYDYIIMDTENGKLCYQHIDQTVTTYSSKLEHPEKERIYGVGQLIVWNYDNQTYYYSPQSDTIYRLDTVTWEGVPRYRLDLGKYKMSIETDSKIFFTLRDKHRIVICSLLEISSYLFIEYRYKEKYYIATYNKQSGELISSKANKTIENDFGGWSLSGLKAIPGENNLWSNLTYTAVEKNTAGRSRDELTPVGQREYDLYAGRDVENINIIYRIIHLK